MENWKNTFGGGQDARREDVNYHRYYCGDEEENECPTQSESDWTIQEAKRSA